MTILVRRAVIRAGKATCAEYPHLYTELPTEMVDSDDEIRCVAALLIHTALAAVNVVPYCSRAAVQKREASATILPGRSDFQNAAFYASILPSFSGSIFRRQNRPVSVCFLSALRLAV